LNEILVALGIGLAYLVVLLVIAIVVGRFIYIGHGPEW